MGDCKLVRMGAVVSRRGVILPRLIRNLSMTKSGCRRVFLLTNLAGFISLSFLK